MIAILNDKPRRRPADPTSTCKGRLRKPRLTPESEPTRPPWDTQPEGGAALPAAGEAPTPKGPAPATVTFDTDAQGRSIAAADTGVENRVGKRGGRGRAADCEGSAFTLYLREIGQVKPLTAPEEVALAARIKRGDKRARERMIKANLRLVVAIARDYENIGLPLLDLVSEGNLGLLKAVERFDPASGTGLAAYSSWWIRQAIKRALTSQAGRNERTRSHVRS